MRFKVNKDQRVLVYKDGDYQKVLGAGWHWTIPFSGISLQYFSVDEEFKPKRNLNLYLEDKKLAEELDVVEVADNEVVLLYVDSRFSRILSAGRYAFWKALGKNTFVRVDLSKPEVVENIQKAVLSLPEVSKYIQVFAVAGYEKGLLFYNGEFKKVLSGGEYYFWKGPVKVSVVNVDTRQLQVDVAGQEIMTKDKVTLRLNFAMQYRITDPVKAVVEINDYKSQLYVLTQLVLREYVGTFSLEELLEKKEEIGRFILLNLEGRGKAMGLELIYAGVKDVILPGEMKTILSQVIEAEKKAQANIITRREETASTRSLLNTARLMESNPILLRLKELEYIESIAGRIESLSVSGSQPLIEQLGQLFSAQAKR